MHLDVAPYNPDGPVLVAAGDKDGNVGLWRVDADEDAAATAERTDDEEGDGSEDGVLFFKPHGSYVCHLKWGRGGLGGKLVSCAYDGVVRALDAEKAAFVELFASEDDDEFSACDVSADGREMHLVDNHGNYHRVDVRAGKLAAPAVQLHEKKINTVHLEPGAERAIATSCGDQTGRDICSPRATTTCSGCGAPRGERASPRGRWTRTQNPRSRYGTTTRPEGGCCRFAPSGPRARTASSSGACAARWRSSTRKPARSRRSSPTPIA